MLFINGFENIVSDDPSIIILLSLIIGLFLNSSKAHRMAWWLLRVDAACNRKGLRAEILNNFEITIDHNEYDTNRKYVDKTQNIGEQIIDLFVALYHPELSAKLQSRRNEVDVTVMSLASVFLFGIAGILTGCVLLCNNFCSQTGYFYFINSGNQYFMLAWSIVSVVIPFFVYRGSKRLDKQLAILTRLTGMIVFTALNHKKASNKAVVDDFIDKLVNERLIVKDIRNTGYIVNI
jgi:hypothetical protein